MCDKEDIMALNAFLSLDWVMRALEPATLETALETQEERNTRCKRENEEHMLNRPPWDKPTTF